MAFSNYGAWKEKVSTLYARFTNHHLSWPSLSCRWGPRLEEKRKTYRQRLYLCQQTDGTEPNTLVIANVEVFRQGARVVRQISQFDEGICSPFVEMYKTILHPGEVNRIKEVPTKSNIVATHTDSPNVLIWDVEAQPSCHAVGAAEPCPDLILTGHQQNAQFALAICATKPLVLSGGEDKLVLLWNIQDHISTLGEASSTKYPTALFDNSRGMDSPTVEPQGFYKGHTDTVEDVQFRPSSEHEFCSVGDDSCLIFWDARLGTGPITKVQKAHNADVHCVDWNNADLILTGSADFYVHMFDRRKLSSEGVTSRIHRFHHTACVSWVQWSPDVPSVFGSATEDGFIDVWDYKKVGKKRNTSSRMLPTRSGLLFQHAGQRDNKLLDFHWNPSDPWTIASVSQGWNRADGKRVETGGTLQIWRMSDSIYSAEEDDSLERIRYLGRLPCSKLAVDV